MRRRACFVARDHWDIPMQTMIEVGAGTSYDCIERLNKLQKRIKNE